MNSSLTLKRGYRWLASLGRRNAASAERPDAATWNAQYEAGRWAYLGELSELSRYSVLVGYMAHFKPGGAVLDIGCGEGVLYRRLASHGYSRYVGVDVASSAIARLNASQAGATTTFVAADGEHYLPNGGFDIIVFNEVLYFFHDAVAAVERYAQSLTPDGVILVSTCTGFRKGMPMLHRLKRALVVLDETRITHGTNEWSWICTVLVPPARNGSGPRTRDALHGG